MCASIAALSFEMVARLPATGDNVAIACRRLEAGVEIEFGKLTFSLSHTVLEGHRFAVQAIQEGAPLLSWSLPFGYALRAIRPGEYICNEKILHALEGRHVGFPLPASPNFKDFRQSYHLDGATFV